MDKDQQIEFLIEKLLAVSENTIEPLVLLKEELSNSRGDHGKQVDLLTSIIDRFNKLENAFINFKERKPIEFLETIKENQMEELTILRAVKEVIHDSTVEEDLLIIKEKVETQAGRDEFTRKLVIGLSVANSLALAVIGVIKYFF